MKSIRVALLANAVFSAINGLLTTVFTQSLAEKLVSADVEADGVEELNPGAGGRKGLCYTEGRPAKRLK